MANKFNPDPQDVPERDVPEHDGGKETKLTELQKQIDKLVAEREKLKGAS